MKGARRVRFLPVDVDSLAENIRITSPDLAYLVVGDGISYFIYRAFRLAFFLYRTAGDSIPGDANRDGIVNAADAAALAANWLTTDGSATWSQGDFNEDGNVDDIDATILATNWQSTASASVPEPGTLALLAAIFTAMLAIRRKR